MSAANQIWRGEAGASTGVASLPTDEGARAESEVGAAGSSVDLWDTITHGERSGSAYIQATKRSEGSGDGRVKRILTPQRSPGSFKLRYAGKRKRSRRRDCISEPKEGYLESRVRENRQHGLMRGDAVLAMAFPTLRFPDSNQEISQARKAGKIKGFKGDLNALVGS